MRSELRDQLARARDGAPVPRFDLDALGRRRDRRASRRRVEALVVGLGILMVLVAGAFAWQRPGGRSVAGAGHDLGPIQGWHAPPALSFPPHGYRYERRVQVEIQPAQGGNPASVLSVSDADVVGQSWYGIDDSGRTRQSGGGSHTFPPGNFPNDTGDLSGLSSEPATLLDQLVQRTGPDGASPEPYTDWTTGPETPLTAGIVRAGGELLNDANATPALRAAVAQVIAGLDGATVRRGRDPFGRSAVELSIQTEGALHHWWFDPDTLQLLASTNEAPQGESYWVLVVEASGYVGTTDSTHPDAGFVPELTVDTHTPVSSAP